MDFVPKENRAVWNSLESVTSFGWSGSAALGGWLIHRVGFHVTFLITATMQVRCGRGAAARHTAGGGCRLGVGASCLLACQA